jgi:hypothetical protein
VFRFKLFSPMGGDAGEVAHAVPTVLPGETIRTGDGRVLKVLEAAYDLPPESIFRGLLTVELLEERH